MSRVADRRSIRSFRKSSNTWAATLCALDVSMSAVALAAVVVLPSMFEKLIASLLLGLQIARLFVLGHDACHQSLFESRRLNRWVGRLLFLPSLTPYSAWEVGHNLGHHVYTNLRGMDHVWTPLSKAEFDALPDWRKLLQRFYRSGFGYGAYYLVELWWRELFFASAARIPARRNEVLADSVLVTGFLLGWAGLLIVAAYATHQDAVVLVMTGFVVPFLVWNWLMGAVIYFHHTNPQLPWYDDIDQWQAARDTGCNTVHVQFRGKLGRLLNNIMEHPAHHLDVRIPLYNLEAANRALDVTSHVAQTLSPRSLYACIRSCKLYDYQAHHWTDFSGRRTGPTLGGGGDEGGSASAGTNVAHSGRMRSGRECRSIGTTTMQFPTKAIIAIVALSAGALSPASGADEPASPDQVEIQALQRQVEALSQELANVKTAADPRTQRRAMQRHWSMLQDYMRSWRQMPGMDVKGCTNWMIGYGMMGRGATGRRCWNHGAAMVAPGLPPWALPNETPEQYQKRMQRLQQEMRKQMTAIAAETDPAKRDALIHGHYETMYWNMETPRGMS